MTTEKVEKATAGFVVSLIAGIIDALVAVGIMALGSFLAGFEETLEVSFGAGFALATLGSIGLILAILVIVGAVLIYMPGKEVIGGILVLVFSVISLFFTLGGLGVGLILGIIGGILGIVKK